MRFFQQTEADNVCMVRMSKSTCKRAGYAVFMGAGGPFYRCRMHFRKLELSCDDVVIDRKNPVDMT